MSEPKNLMLDGVKDYSRFFQKVLMPRDLDKCWLWLRGENEHGYGYFRIDGKTVKAHRVSYVHWKGEIPSGMDVDHVCHNKPCVNPDHLRTATRAENMQNRKGARRDSASGVRGVTLQPDGRYRARVKHDGRNHCGGVFDTITEAEAAAIALRNKLFTHNDMDRTTDGKEAR